MEPLFEQHPWAVVAIIIVTIEGWQLFKAAVSRLLRQSNRNGFSRPGSGNLQD